MSGWRDRILGEFAPGVAPLTLVSDPDGLLVEEGVLEEIAERGIEVVRFEEPIAFRFAYESRFRSRRKRGEAVELVVALGSAGFEALPHDVLRVGRRLSFQLGELFPNLSAAVVSALDRRDFDSLDAACEREPPRTPLGESRTRDFVLRRVFGFAPETLRGAPDLLHFLLRRHYGELRIPADFDGHLIRALRENARFANWPLEQIAPDREAFYRFLQERWPGFVEGRAECGGAIAEPRQLYPLEFRGPSELPFGHPDVRIYVDNLFLEGALRPHVPSRPGAAADSWMLAGGRRDPGGERARRLDGLLGALGGSIPGAEARHADWLAFARRWARLNALWHRGASDDTDGRIAGLAPDCLRVRRLVDGAFAAWIGKRFGTLHNQPPSPPVMLHHAPRFLAGRLAREPGAKAALVVMDGLSLDQWLTIRDAVAERRRGLVFREGGVFAWIPTITAVSRQACFAGRPPMYFPRSIGATNREESGWKRFWGEEGLDPAAVAYAKGLRRDDDLGRVEEMASRPKARVIGLVVDAVDRIMHGMELGAAGMHNQVRQWAGKEFLGGLFDLLLESGFAVFVTSDHGNIEAEGCGRPDEGSLAGTRGERVRVYDHERLRRSVSARFPGAREWPPVGLPERYFALLAPGRRAFLAETERRVVHGGAALEEVIVPFVEVGRR